MVERTRREVAVRGLGQHDLVMLARVQGQEHHLIRFRGAAVGHDAPEHPGIEILQARQIARLDLEMAQAKRHHGAFLRVGGLSGQA
jgi:hypothetical protein